MVAEEDQLNEPVNTFAVGVPASWLDDGAVGVTGLPTYYGTLDLHLRRMDDEIVHTAVRLLRLTRYDERYIASVETRKRRRMDYLDFTDFAWFDGRHPRPIHYNSSSSPRANGPGRHRRPRTPRS